MATENERLPRAMQNLKQAFSKYSRQTSQPLIQMNLPQNDSASKSQILNQVSFTQAPTVIANYPQMQGTFQMMQPHQAMQALWGQTQYFGGQCSHQCNPCGYQDMCNPCQPQQQCIYIQQTEKKQKKKKVIEEFKPAPIQRRPRPQYQLPMGNIDFVIPDFYQPPPPKEQVIEIIMPKRYKKEIIKEVPVIKEVVKEVIKEIPVDRIVEKIVQAPPQVITQYKDRIVEVQAPPPKQQVKIQEQAPPPPIQREPIVERRSSTVQAPTEHRYIALQPRETQVDRVYETAPAVYVTREPIVMPPMRLQEQFPLFHPQRHFSDYGPRFRPVGYQDYPPPQYQDQYQPQYLDQYYDSPYQDPRYEDY